MLDDSAYQKDFLEKCSKRSYIGNIFCNVVDVLITTVSTKSYTASVESISSPLSSPLALV
jgi:hypothetical protein